MPKKYIEPELKIYPAKNLLEVFGPMQNQYTTVTFNTTAGNSSNDVDGFINNPIGGVEFSADIVVGDDEDNNAMRGFVGFNISSIPSGSRIVSATLRLYQYDVEATPYGASNLGDIVVDHVNFGTSLSVNDFGNTNGSDALTANIGTFSTSASIGWKELDVINYVQADMDSTTRTSSQFRLRFQTLTDSDFIDENPSFEDAENAGGTGNTPQLVVIYN